MNNMDDIEQFVMNEASQASYTDEEKITGWAEKVTATFPTVTGEPLPSSKSATGQVLETRAAISSFKMIKDNIGFFLQRWLKRQAFPILMKNIRIGDVVRMTGSFEELKERDELLANKMIAKKFDEFIKRGVVPNPDQMVRARDAALEQLRSMGEDRFVRLLEEIDFTKHDVQVYVTNEEIDKGVLATNINNALARAPQYAPILIRQLFDIMGLNVPELERETQKLQAAGQLSQAPPTPGAQQEQGVPVNRSIRNPLNEQQTVTEANTL